MKNRTLKDIKYICICCLSFSYTLLYTLSEIWFVLKETFEGDTEYTEGWEVKVESDHCSGTLVLYINYILRRGGRWHLVITTLLAPSVIQQRDIERGGGYSCICVWVCVCVHVQMDQQDRVSRWHTIDFHPRCWFDYFGQNPTIFREHCFTKAFSYVQI